MTSRVFPAVGSCMAWASVAGATFPPGRISFAPPSRGRKSCGSPSYGTGGRASRATSRWSSRSRKAAKSRRCSRVTPAPAYCDVDKGHWVKRSRGGSRTPSSTRTTAKMFDRAREGDGPRCSSPSPITTTPAPAAIGLQAGKAVYCEKPLTWSVSEARALAELAAEEKRSRRKWATRGHANEGNRRVVEWGARRRDRRHPGSA